MSGASKRANGRASSPVLTSGFLIDLAHCGVLTRGDVMLRLTKAQQIDGFAAAEDVV